MAQCKYCTGQQGSWPNLGDCDLLQAAYILAGLAMMLNIRLSYSSAPYALIRFRLPENLFSVFVRRMASALELWCLPSMLLGNIMDLIQKLIDENPELRAIKDEAEDIKTKATALKSTANSESTSEITTTRNNDIEGDTTKGGELTGKAGELQTKASELYDAAHGIVTAAQTGTGELATLNEPAGNLKNKAGNASGGNTGLYYAANQLASDEAEIETKAKDVIEKFEEVQQEYEALMKQAAKLTIPPDQNDKVTAVTTKFEELKGIYNGMLNLTKLKDKSGTLSSTATSQSGSGLGKLDQKPSQLATKAQLLSQEAAKIDDPDLQTDAQAVAIAAGTAGLQTKASELSRTQDYTKAKPVIEAFYTVKENFDQLIKVAIERSKLELVQDVISKFDDLKNHYDGMMPFTKIRYYSEQILILANTLRNTGTNAEKIVRYFESMKLAYNKLTEEQKKNVKNLFDALKNAYDLILNVTKMKQPATNLDIIATGLNSNKTVLYAKHFKTEYDAFKEVFNSITVETDKKKVQSAWEALKNVIDGAMKRWKFYWIIVPSIICQWLNFLTYVLLLIVYLMGGDQGHLTMFYFVIAISGVVFGINMTLVYSVDFYYIPVYIAGENSFPILTSFIHYISTLIFGNRRKYNSDFIIVNIDIWVAIIISFVAAVVWTYGYLCEGTPVGDMKHIHAFGFGGNLDWHQMSPFLMIVVGMGLVYAIYPGIAPGMIVPFYLIDKIEMVLLIATIFPPVIIAILRKHDSTKKYSPQYFDGSVFRFRKWSEYPAGYFYLFLNNLMVIKITLAAIFIYCLHYRESHISRSIINQPKMSTFLSITFYMCHEILLALGFAGFIGNDGGDYILIPQYIGALFMIFLAFYSEGYIIEYKSHDPAQWPTEGMGMWYLCVNL